MCHIISNYHQNMCSKETFWWWCPLPFLSSFSLKDLFTIFRISISQRSWILSKNSLCRHHHMLMWFNHTTNYIQLGVLCACTLCPIAAGHVHVFTLCYSSTLCPLCQCWHTTSTPICPICLSSNAPQTGPKERAIAHENCLTCAEAVGP